MHLCHSLRLLAIFLFLSCGSAAAATQDKSSDLKQHGEMNQEEPLKAISMPPAQYPDEAVKKKIEGKVTLTIVVDRNGTVSEVRALSGPAELIPAAIASAKAWKFEPPAHAPVTKMAEVSFGFPKECPAPVSDFGEVIGTGRLLNKDGKLIAVSDNDDYRLPFYPVEERKTGVAGTMILSVNLGADGNVKEIQIVKSLSPRLDQLATDAVRPMKFKRADENSTASLKDLRIEFLFRASCHFMPD